MIDRKKLEEQLLNQMKRSYETANNYLMAKTIFKPDLDVQFWTCKEGTHVIDILPYIAGKNNPHAKPGESTYLLDLWVHYGVGVNDDAYICLAKTYGKRCPICEYRKDILRKGEEVERANELMPKRRVVYAIVCYDSKEEEDKGVQVWEVAHFFMERHLVELAKNPRTGGMVLFASPYKEQGKSIQFTRRGRGRGNVEFIGHKFLDRDYDIDKKLLEQVPCLDELIYIPTYEEVYEAFHGERVEEKRERRRVREEVKEETVEEEAVEEETIEEEIAPRRKHHYVRREVEEVEEPEESVEAEKSEKAVEERGKTPRCPAGGVFGRDIDEFDHCAWCELYDKCFEEFERLEKERKRGRLHRARR